MIRQWVNIHVSRQVASEMSTLLTRTTGTIQNNRRWGPLDLETENVHRSVNANRQDTVCDICSATWLYIVAWSSCAAQEEYLQCCASDTSDSAEYEDFGHYPGCIRSQQQSNQASSAVCFWATNSEPLPIVLNLSGSLFMHESSKQTEGKT